MKLKLRNEYGDMFVNLLRQFCLTTTAEVKPIAFAVGTESNVVDIGNLAEEDMTEFISNVCQCRFVAKSEKSLLVWTGMCDGVLHAESVKNDEVTVYNTARPLLHTLGPLQVTIYFRNTDGSHENTDNDEFLVSHNVDTSHLVIIPSRHDVVKTFRFSKEEVDANYSVYDVTVDCFYGISGDEYLKSKIAAVQAVTTDLLG